MTTLGLIGLGRIGAFHAETLTNLPNVERLVVTDERPHEEKLRIAAEGWHAPLDLVDGAARVYDPIVRGEAGEDLYGCFVKDYEPSPW